MTKIYKHFKGDLYKIICQADCEAEPDNPDKVIIAYKRADGTGKTWYRPADEFHGYATITKGPNERMVRRFAPLL